MATTWIEAWSVTLILIQAAFDAGACNLDEANGAIHPTTGYQFCAFVLKYVDYYSYFIIICCQGVFLFHDHNLSLDTNQLLWRPGRFILLQCILTTNTSTYFENQFSKSIDEYLKIDFQLRL